MADLGAWNLAVRVEEGTVRVLVGTFFLESNSFAKGLTGIDQFAVAGLRVGQEVTRTGLPSGGELASAWDVLESRGIEVVPALYAWSSPGPPIPAADFAEITRMLLDNVPGDIDGVYLQLHGSALAEGVDDPEGEILHGIRRLVGAHVPIAISLDCHANLTERMCAVASIVTAYRTVPHTDLARAGRQAAELLIGALDGDIVPTLVVTRVPLITPADLHDNDYPPFGSLMRAAEAAEEIDGVLSVAVLPVTPWLDLPDVGWRVAVTTDGDEALARSIANRIAGQAWDDRAAFFRGQRPPIDEALALALREPAPFVIADAGDATNGGAPGDSTCLLRAAMARPEHRVFLTIADAAAAQRLAPEPIGSVVATTLGDGGTGEYNEATTITATVLAHPDGAFEYAHPFSRGQRADLGSTTVLGLGEMRIVVHERPVGVIDPSPYVAAGLDPMSAAVLQAKSHISYRIGFAAVTERSVVADTPGPTTANLSLLTYLRRPIPLYPFEEPDFDVR